jgi:caa(3)-type oxidase subunit IV
VTPSSNASRAASPSLRALLLAGAVLLLLAALSFALSFFGLGKLALPVALLIAVGKASTVLYVFMEVGRIPTSAKLGVLAALAMFALLLGLMVADVATRGAAPLAPPLARSAQ